MTWRYGLQLAPIRVSLNQTFVAGLMMAIALLAMGLSATAQDPDDGIFADRFAPNQGPGPNPDSDPFAFVPNQPIAVSFTCGMLYLDTMALSQNTYFFEFGLESLTLGLFRTDQGTFVQLAGQYTYQNNEIHFTASNGLGADFAMTTQDIVPKLGIVGYFAARGNGLGRPAELRCLAIGHRYNPEPWQYKRFRCPDQRTLAGTFENTIEINFFDSSINTGFPGSAFRQRDFYSVGNTTGNPDRIERSSNGIFRELDGRYYFDFANPPGIDPPFSDWFQTIADRVMISGTEALLIPDFDPPINACQSVQ